MTNNKLIALADERLRHSIRFKPFRQLVDADGHMSEKTRLGAIEALMLEGRWVDAEQQARLLFDLAAAGIDYFQTCIPTLYFR